MTIFSDDVLMLHAADMEEWYEQELLLRSEQELRQQALRPGGKAVIAPLFDITSRINELSPGHNSTPGSVVVHDSAVAANFINQWTIFNTSFAGGANFNTGTLGAMVPAPDASLTAQKFIENTNNGTHSLQCVVMPKTASFLPSQTVYVVVKAGDHRTRIALTVDFFGRYPTGSPLSGITSVFDLAGGQVAVSGVPFGQSQVAPGVWTHFSDSITSVGLGYYKCAMNWALTGHGVVTMTLEIDAGSGLQSQNTNYVGDGTGSILIYTSNCLPTRATQLTHQVFFDDFLTSATIDLANTRQPGFNWYLQNNFIGADSSFPTTPASAITVANSVMTLAGSGLGILQLLIASIFQGAPSGTFGGKVFTPPMLIEARLNWNTAQAPHNATSAFWTHDAHDMVTINGGTPQRTWTAAEVDYYEDITGGGSFAYLPSLTAAVSTSPAFGGIEAQFNNTPRDAYPTWGAGINYNAVNNPVFLNGTYYGCILANTNQMPPNATFWDVLTPSPATPIDFSQFHIFSILWLPYLNSTDRGQMLTFVDGSFGGSFIYGPEVDNSSVHFQDADNLLYPILIQGGDGYTVNYDWVSVITP